MTDEAQASKKRNVNHGEPLSMSAVSDMGRDKLFAMRSMCAVQAAVKTTSFNISLICVRNTK